MRTVRNKVRKKESKNTWARNVLTSQKNLNGTQSLRLQPVPVPLQRKSKEYKFTTNRCYDDEGNKKALVASLEAIDSEDDGIAQAQVPPQHTRPRNRRVQRRCAREAERQIRAMIGVDWVTIEEVDDEQEEYMTSAMNLRKRKASLDTAGSSNRARARPRTRGNSQANIRRAYYPCNRT